MVLLGGYLPCCSISTAPNILIGCLIAIFSILIDFSVILAIDHLNERMEKEEELFDLEKNGSRSFNIWKRISKDWRIYAW